ncbi:PE-PPE domain-containing protein [Actinocatenispora rupis]|uniref:PE-PPE domain-containing protein n=1 Tax=Actinocatenispora rupis TaxID=519421 RepID=UPI001944BF43|nr:PE-PPE domain-containing protein [Actinocatenispora rupis]
MNLLRTRRRRVGALVASAVAVVAAVGTWAGPSYAAGSDHYYIEAGGTGSVPVDGKGCTVTYGYANRRLDGGIAVPVCYPASGGPFVGPHNEMPDLSATGFDESVRLGYKAMLAAVEETHRAHPDATITIVGYSQGAWVGDLVLQTLASGATDVPKKQVNGMLYADPMQPGTGLWATVPKGVGLAGVTSPGPGPETFDGIHVRRFCIHTDGVCDATSLRSIEGLLANHPRYPQENGILPQTIAADGGDGIRWYD